jgi:predicted thioesterase
VVRALLLAGTTLAAGLSHRVLLDRSPSILSGTAARAKSGRLTDMPISTGLSAQQTFTVADDDTAAALGSGDLPVLGTPRLLAWCEATTCAALAEELTEAETSVGTRITLEHLAPSPVGREVAVTASVAHVDGRLVRFTVAATDAGKLVGSGEVTRVVVDQSRFLGRLG